MKQIQNLIIAVLTIAVCILFYLQFKSNNENNVPKIDITGKKMPKDFIGKVAFINTDTFFEKYTKFKEIESQMEKEQKTIQTNFEAKAKSLEKEYMNLMQSAQAGKIDMNAAKAKEQEIMKKKQALDSEGQVIAKNIQSKSMKAGEEIQKTLFDYFSKNKDKYNCNYVVGFSKGGSIYYVDPSLDITNQVLKELND